MYLSEGIGELLPDSPLPLVEELLQVTSHRRPTRGHLRGQLRIQLSKELLYIAILEGGKGQIRIDNISDGELVDALDFGPRVVEDLKSPTLHPSCLLELDNR